jgi:hypothetical protein
MLLASDFYMQRFVNGKGIPQAFHDAVTEVINTVTLIGSIGIGAAFFALGLGIFGVTFAMASLIGLLGFLMGILGPPWIAAWLLGNLNSATVIDSTTYPAPPPPPPPPGDHGCPNLLVWNGGAFVDEGLLSIHNLVNPDSDVVLKHTLNTIPAVTDHNLYTLELYEHPKGYNVSHSWLNQAMLFAVDTKGILHRCDLVSATHSRDGNVLPLLLRNDDKWAETYFGDKIVLQFTAPHVPNIDHFVFVLVGHNRK